MIVCSIDCSPQILGHEIRALVAIFFSKALDIKILHIGDKVGIQMSFTPPICLKQLSPESPVQA